MFSEPLAQRAGGPLPLWARRSAGTQVLSPTTPAPPRTRSREARLSTPHRPTTSGKEGLTQPRTSSNPGYRMPQSTSCPRGDPSLGADIAVGLGCGGAGRGAVRAQTWGEQVTRPMENSLTEPASSPGLQIRPSLGQEVPPEDGVFRLEESGWTERNRITEDK